MDWRAAPTLRRHWAQLTRGTSSDKAQAGVGQPVDRGHGNALEEVDGRVRWSGAPWSTPNLRDHTTSQVNVKGKNRRLLERGTVCEIRARISELLQTRLSALSTRTKRSPNEANSKQRSAASLSLITNNVILTLFQNISCSSPRPTRHRNTGYRPSLQGPQLRCSLRENGSRLLKNGHLTFVDNSNGRSAEYENSRQRACKCLFVCLNHQPASHPGRGRTTGTCKKREAKYLNACS